MFGFRIENMLVNGRTIKCMEKEELNGLMVKFMKVIMRTIKNMDLELLFGLMEGNMLDSGRKVSKMVGEITIFRIKAKK